MAIPISAAMKYSAYATEVVAWSLLAAVIQIVTYLIACAITGQTKERLEQGDYAAAIMVAAAQIAVALITAAALSG